MSSRLVSQSYFSQLAVVIPAGSTAFVSISCALRRDASGVRDRGAGIARLKLDFVAIGGGGMWRLLFIALVYDLVSSWTWGVAAWPCTVCVGLRGAGDGQRNGAVGVCFRA
jgi:hypothetical protein